MRVLGTLKQCSVSRSPAQKAVVVRTPSSPATQVTHRAMSLRLVTSKHQIRCLWRTRYRPAADALQSTDVDLFTV